MKKKFTKLTFIAAFAFAAQGVSAQVRGVGFTLAPLGERVWWDEKSGLKDAYLYGGQVGFSFGRNVELRGLYQTSSSLKRDFSYYGISADDLEKLDVTFEKWGGDLKLNLGNGALLPYLTVGTGVQNTKLGDFDKNKQIYFSGGLGIMIGFGDRASLALQALHTSFRDNPVGTLLTSEERLKAGISAADYDYERMKNWSGRASLLFYVGGTNPSNLSDVDKAYINTFSSGLKGISLPIEPMVGKFDWSSKLPYRNTHFGGLATGLDFGPLVGVRAYYLRSFDDELFSGWDKLEIWGGEGKFKLASTGALIPFLNVGGGQINVLNGYKGSVSPKDTMSVEGRAFASGGGGFDIVLSRHIKLSAFAKAMLTSTDKNYLENTNSPDDLATSWMYGASLNLILGKKPTSPEFKSQNDSYDTQVKADLDKEKRNTRELRAKYIAQIDKLESEIEKAYKAGKSSEMNDKFEEQERLKKMVSKLDVVLEKERAANSSSDYVKMNPTEFKTLIDEIKESQKRQEEILKNSLEMQKMQSELNTERLNARIKALEDSSEKKSKTEKDKEEYEKLRKELNQLQKKNVVDDEDDEIAQLRKEIEKQKAAKVAETEKRKAVTISEVDSKKDNEIKELRKKLEEVQAGKSELIKTNEKEVETLKKELEAVKSKKGKSNQKEVESLQAKITELETKKTSLVDSNEELVKSLREQLQKAEADKAAKASEKEDEVAALQAKLDQLQKAKEDAKKQKSASREEESEEISQLRQQISELEKGKSNLKKSSNSEVEELKNEISRLKNEKNSVKEDRRKAEDPEVKALRKELQELRENKYESSQSNDKEVEKLRKQLKELQENDNINEGESDAVVVEEDDVVLDKSFPDGRKYGVKGMSFISEAQLAHVSKDSTSNNGFFNRFYYEGASVLGGFNIGGNATFNIGLRQHYRYNKSNVFFMPEAFFGFGSPASFGIFANGIYQFDFKKVDSFEPYAGVGLGVMQAGNNAKTRLGFNIVLGANLFSVGSGRLYVDFNTRNFFSYNQFALGYRLPF